LNEAARQGRGEASATLRNDHAGLIWLAPGSLENSTGQAWEATEFAGANAEQQAVNFLNLAPRESVEIDPLLIVAPARQPVATHGNGFSLIARLCALPLATDRRWL
jgi:hypothetical protein